MQENNLSKYGSSFQLKALAALMLDNGFLSQVFDILLPGYFESESSQWILNVILKHYTEYKKAPTLDVFKVKLDKEDNETKIAEIKNTLRQVVKQYETTDLDFIKETILTFCKNQAIKNAILESANYLNLGNYDKIREIILKAMQAGTEPNIGLDYVEDIMDRYSEESRNAVSTGWEEIDMLMQGGLSYGELGLILAASGAGKTWVLAALGAAALNAGKKVLHITLELQENITALRYDTIITGMPVSTLKGNIKILESKIEKLPGNLLIKWFPAKRLSISGLEAYLNKIISQGFTPDLIIIDYIDLMKILGKGDKHDELGDLYEEVRGLSGIFGIPIWSASQTNRDGISIDVVDASKISGAYAKIFTCDFVLSLSRTQPDKITKTGRFHVIKNRFGADGLTLPAIINPEIGLIQIHSPSTSEGRDIKSTMVEHKTFQKSILKDKYDALNQKNKLF